MRRLLPSRQTNFLPGNRRQFRKTANGAPSEHLAGAPALADRYPIVMKASICACFGRFVFHLYLGEAKILAVIVLGETLMRKSLWLTIAIVLALTTLTWVSRAQSAGNDIPPQVVDTDPARGEELALDGAITFYFDQPMDRASVESAFRVNPAVQGVFEWPNDSTAAFRPATRCSATVYAFVMDSAAKAKRRRPADTFSIVEYGGLLAVAGHRPWHKAVEATPTIL
jgi:hypothetical protein